MAFFNHGACVTVFKSSFSSLASSMSPSLYGYFVFFKMLGYQDELVLKKKLIVLAKNNFYIFQHICASFLAF